MADYLITFSYHDIRGLMSTLIDVLSTPFPLTGTIVLEIHALRCFGFRNNVPVGFSSTLFILPMGGLIKLSISFVLGGQVCLFFSLSFQALRKNSSGF